MADAMRNCTEAGVQVGCVGVGEGAGTDGNVIWKIISLQVPENRRSCVQNSYIRI